MKVRGERECQDCGAQWSYYETGEPSCPACGSLRSLGVGGRALHTDSPATLDLTDHRTRFGEARGTLPAEGVTDLKRDLREHVHARGFIRGGEPLVLDETYLAAHELLHAVDVYDRLVDPTDDDRAHLLALLAGAGRGERPAPGAVPPNMRGARGLAVVDAVGAYREDLRAYLDEHPDPAARDALGSIRERVKRLDSLQGDVDPEAAESLVAAANDVGRHLRGEPNALKDARDRIAEFEP